jgi:hypothetical protein
VDSRQFRIISILLGVIGAALLAIILVLVFGSSDDEEPTAAPDATTAAPTPVTTLPAPTLPPAPATTLPAPTLPPAPTTTAAPPPTTSAATTTTEAPPPPTTTTGPPPLPLVLQDDGIGGVPFGADPDTTIAYAESVLGAAKNDTGWVDSFSKYGTCPGPVVRGVEWGGEGSGFGFVLLFTEAATDHLPGGGQHLFGYYYFGDPDGLATGGGISVGSTLGDALAAHPGSTVEEHPLVPGSGSWFVDDVEGDDSLLWGFAEGLGADDTLTSINGGITCGE